MIRSLKSRLERGSAVYGSWLTLGSGLTTEIMGRAGFDWLLIDLEHGLGDFRDLATQLQVLEGTAAAPIVRVPCSDPWLIKRVLDIGASGLLIPLIDTADEARQVVRAMRYPPRGIRGVSVGTRATRFGVEFDDYFRTADDNLLLAVQIERIAAVSNAHEIAAVDGVDVLFVGPVDLTVAYGFPRQLHHPRVQSALRRVEAAAFDHGKQMGILLPSADLVPQFCELGYRLIAVGTEVSMLRSAAASVVTACHCERS